MKIQFNYSKAGGPGVFMKRLKEYLCENCGVNEVKKSPQLYLSAVWLGNPPPKTKIIHRVDNVYFDELNPQRKKSNQKIKRALQIADGVVFQSVFSKNICKGILGVEPKRYKIIYNAIDQKQYINCEPIQHSYDYLFIACAKWRPLKRPKSIAYGFLEASLPNSALYVIGSIGTNEKVRDSKIKYLGEMNPKLVMRYYRSSTALIHLARLDACPNTVVESLSVGKPVICNNSGGTPELVKDDGIILNIDPPDNFKTFAMKHVDSVNKNIIAEGIHQCINKQWNINRPEFDMSYCSSQYYQFCREVLGI